MSILHNFSNKFLIIVKRCWGSPSSVTLNDFVGKNLAPFRVQIFKHKIPLPFERKIL